MNIGSLPMTVCHGTLLARIKLMYLTSAEAVQQALNNANKVTEAQIKAFLDICRIKYLRAKIEPGRP